MSLNKGTLWRPQTISKFYEVTLILIYCLSLYVFHAKWFFFNPFEAREDFETCNLGYGYLQYNICSETISLSVHCICVWFPFNNTLFLNRYIDIICLFNNFFISSQIFFRWYYIMALLSSVSRQNGFCVIIWFYLLFQIIFINAILTAVNWNVLITKLFIFKFANSVLIFFLNHMHSKKNIKNLFKNQEQKCSCILHEAELCVMQRFNFVSHGLPGSIPWRS